MPIIKNPTPETQFAKIPKIYPILYPIVKIIRDPISK